MERWEIIALCERWGVPKRDWCAFVRLIQGGKMTGGFARRILGPYKPVLAEVYAILSATGRNRYEV